MVFLNSNPMGRNWGKTLPLERLRFMPESAGTGGTCGVLIVKIGKGIHR
jgi:hypothetical protein